MVERIARAVIFAIGIWMIVANLSLFSDLTTIGWDVSAYWDAATRLRDGGQLYVSYGDPNATELYRYAPWFAWAWVPLTHLPERAVTAVWTAVMVACSFAAIWPAIRARCEAGYVAALLAWPLLAFVSLGGNVHAAMVAGLVIAIGTRWGPLAIALAASLKAVPILLVLMYLGRREWMKAGATIAMTAILVAPMLLYDLREYTTSPGGGDLLTGWLWVMGVAAASLVTLVVARTRYAWLAAATAVTIAFPRWFLYDASLLLVGFPRVESDRARAGR